jgi:hypothetical protein
MVGRLMNVAQFVELELAGETEVLEENLPHCEFVHNLTWHRTRSATVGPWRLTA